MRASSALASDNKTTTTTTKRIGRAGRAHERQTVEQLPLMTANVAPVRLMSSHSRDCLNCSPRALARRNQTLHGVGGSARSLEAVPLAAAQRDRLDQSERPLAQLGPNRNRCSRVNAGRIIWARLAVVFATASWQRTEIYAVDPVHGQLNGPLELVKQWALSLAEARNCPIDLDCRWKPIAEQAKPTLHWQVFRSYLLPEWTPRRRQQRAPLVPPPVQPRRVPANEAHPLSRRPFRGRVS